jgi:hypothetical protein
MSTKTLILCNLALLAFGEFTQEAIASPKPTSVTPSTTPRWSSDRDPQPSQTPQWSDTGESNSTSPPQWRDRIAPQPNSNPSWSDTSDRDNTTIQWTDQSNPPSSVPSSPKTANISNSAQLPHALPGLSAPSPNRDIAQTTNSENERNTVSAPTVESAQTNEESPKQDDFTETDSSLTHSAPMQPTGEYLRQGEVSFNVYNRLYFPPNYIENAVFDSDTGAYPTFGFSWGITDDLQLSLQFQQIDSGSPGRQGDFESLRRPADDEIAIEIKQKLWENASETLNLSGVVSVGWGNRDFVFTRPGQRVEEANNSIVPAIQLPFSAAIGDRWRFTISPTLAFFGDESASFYHRLPIDDPGSFGTTFGFAGAVSFAVTPELILWGDAFIPVTGNNSISRESGRPETAIGYNAGLRYLVNPQLAVDVFASNTQGNKGPLALTADRDLVSFGAGVVFMPDFFGANRRNRETQESPLTTDGLGFLDGGTLNSGQFALNLQAGIPGISTAIRYGFVEDFEGGIYLDYTFGSIDESEQGLSAKIRFLNQAQGAPLTASLAVTISQTNQKFINFYENNRDEFNERGLENNFPLLLNQDDLNNGQLNIFTVSIPLNYQFENGAAVWLTPTLGYVQRMGTEIAGFNAGGAFPIARDFSLIGEVGANFVNPGNAFIGDTRENAIPWTFALRWDPSALFGIEPDEVRYRPYVDLFLTNRVGSSPWHQLRVRDQDRLAIGVGVSIPF